jgi:hypothetical protein
MIIIGRPKTTTVNSVIAMKHFYFFKYMMLFVLGALKVSSLEALAHDRPPSVAGAVRV